VIMIRSGPGRRSRHLHLLRKVAAGNSGVSLGSRAPGRISSQSARGVAGTPDGRLANNSQTSAMAASAAAV
jgi:hypothetical protein